MSEAICKMSVYIEEIREDASVCALAVDVVCEGKHKDRRNCPFWKGSGEP